MLGLSHTEETRNLRALESEAYANVCILGLDLAQLPHRDYCPLAKSYAESLSKALNVNLSLVKDGCGTPGYVSLLGETKEETQDCRCKVTCSSVICPVHERLKPNSQGASGTQESCCDKLCSGFICEPGYKRKHNCAATVGNSNEVCCDKLCSGFNCPDGYTQKLGAESLRGDSVALCCTKTCKNFACPDYSQRKEDAGEILAFDGIACCDELCTGFTCPWGHQLREHAGTIIGADPISCCTQADVDSSLVLPPVKVTRPQVQGNTSVVQLPPVQYYGLEKCSLHLMKQPCPSGTRQKPNAATLYGYSYEDCCDKLCSTTACPPDWKHKPTSSSIVGQGTEVCCDKLCSGLLPVPDPDYWVRKANFENLVGDSLCECYYETCKRYSCPDYHTHKPNASKIIGKSTKECCDKVCSGYTCQRTRPRPDAEELIGDTEEACCEGLKIGCQRISCPEHFKQKPNALTIPERGDLDVDDCCDQTCRMKHCPEGWRHNSSRLDAVGSAPFCCVQLCSSFDCPKPLVPKRECEDKVATSTETCCEQQLQDCGDWYKCEESRLKRKPNPQLIRVPKLSNEACCDKVCNAFACDKGYQHKKGSESILGDSNAVCCEKTCGGFQCPANTLHKCCPIDPEHKKWRPESTMQLPKTWAQLNASCGSQYRDCGLRGAEECSCCYKFCSDSQYKCPGNFVLKEDAAKIILPEGPLADQHLKCCDEACSFYTCPDGFRQKKDADKIRAVYASDCCEEDLIQDCGTFDCASSGLVQKPNALLITGETLSKDMCCDKVCRGFRCDKGYGLRPYANHIVGDSNSACCEKFCSDFKCPADTMPILHASLTPGNDECTCCEKLCSGFVCPPYFVRKPHADGILVDKDDGKGSCCDKACSLFQCPSHLALHKNAASLRGDDVKTCCVVPPTTPAPEVCGEWLQDHDCPDSWRPKPNAAHIRGVGKHKCCDQLCSGFTCPAATTLCKLDKEHIVGCDEATCCDKVCSGFLCPSGSLLRPHAHEIRGWSHKICCKAVEFFNDCSKFECPLYKQLKPNPHLIKSFSEYECCDQLCSGFTCLFPKYINKPDAKELVGQTHEECCDQACPCEHPLVSWAEFYKHKNQGCGECVLPCNFYHCPLYMTLKPNAHKIEGQSPEQCCEELCSGFTCEPGTSLKLAASSIRGFSDEKCCDKVEGPKDCRSFNCSAYNDLYARYVPRPNADALDVYVCPSLAHCCDPLCTNIHCPPPVYKKYPDAVVTKLIGTDPAACCEQSCSIFPCPPGTVALDGFLSDLGKGECCQKMCASVYCPEYQKLKAGADKLIGETVEDCCLPVCSGVTCPDGYAPIFNAENVYGNSKEKCCEQVCDSFKCDEGYVLKQGACFIRGQTKEKCCDKLTATCLHATLATDTSVATLAGKLKSHDLDKDLEEKTKQRLGDSPAVLEVLEVLSKSKQVVSKKEAFVEYSAAEPANTALPGVPSTVSDNLAWLSFAALVAFLGGALVQRMRRPVAAALLLEQRVETAPLMEDFEPTPREPGVQGSSPSLGAVYDL